MTEQVKIPDYVLHNYGVRTSRKWKGIKRQELRKVKHDLSELMRGSFYLPDGGELFREIHEHVKKLETLLSVKNWGN